MPRPGPSLAPTALGLVLSVAGCSSSSSTAGPAITGLTVAPNPNSVLSATLKFTTSRPAVAHAHVVNRGAAANTFDTPVEAQASTSHALSLVGMRALSDFAITVTASDPQGRATTAATTFHTPALPAWLPPVTVVMNDTTQTAPGYLVLDVWEASGTPSAGFVTPLSAVVALDQDLEVVWYTQGYVEDPEKLPNGDFVGITSGSPDDLPLATGWAEVDMMGRTVKAFSAADLGLVGLSHAISPEASGSLLSSSLVLESVGGYPGPGDAGTETLQVVGSDLVELGADGGATVVVDTFNVFDPLDVGDPVLFANGAATDPYFPDAAPTADWMHTNAITADALDGTILASSRNESWIYKVRRDGTLAWRLGPGGDFTLTNQGDTFAYGQHAPYVTASGTILCFDDGLDRPLPEGASPYSRAVEFSLDTSSMTATIVWQYRGSGFYSSILGSAYFLPEGAGGSGTVLIDDGCELSTPSGSVADPTNLKFARVMEVTHATPTLEVAEVDLKLPVGTYPPDPSYSGFVVYRAYKWASLY